MILFFSDGQDCLKILLQLSDNYVVMSDRFTVH